MIKNYLLLPKQKDTVFPRCLSQSHLPQLLGSGNLLLGISDDGFQLGINASLLFLNGRYLLFSAFGLGSLHRFNKSSELLVGFLASIELGNDGFELGVEFLGDSFLGLSSLETVNDGFELGIDRLAFGSTFAKSSELVTKFTNLVTHGGFHHSLLLFFRTVSLVVSNDAFAECLLFSDGTLLLEGFNHGTYTFAGERFHIVGLDGFELGVHGFFQCSAVINDNFLFFTFFTFRHGRENGFSSLFVTTFSDGGSRFCATFGDRSSRFDSWFGTAFSHGSFCSRFGSRFCAAFSDRSSRFGTFGRGFDRFSLSRLVLIGTAFSRSFFATFGRGFFTTFGTVIKGFIAHTVESAEKVILFGTTFGRSSFTTFGTFVTKVEFTNSIGSIAFGRSSGIAFITKVKVDTITTFRGNLGTRFGHIEIEVTSRGRFGTRDIKGEIAFRIGIEGRGFRRFGKTARSNRRQTIGTHFRSGRFCRRIGTTVGKVGSNAIRLGFGSILCGKTSVSAGGQLVDERNQVLGDVVFTLDLHGKRDEVFFGERFTTISLELLGEFIDHKSLRFVVHFRLANLRESGHAIRVFVHSHVQDVIRRVFQWVIGSFVARIQAKTANGFTSGP